jgi:hypothetical protein
MALSMASPNPSPRAPVRVATPGVPQGPGAHSVPSPASPPWHQDGWIQMLETLKKYET